MGFTPFRTSAPNMGAGSINPILGGLLLGLASLPMRMQEQEKAKTEQGYTKALTADAQQLAEQRKQTFETQQRATAQQEYMQLGQRALINPEWQKSPQFRARLEALAKQADLPEPYNADGSFNQNAFLNPLTSIGNTPAEENFRNELFAKQPGADRVNFARSHGIALTPEEAAAAPSYSTKARTDMEKLAQNGLKIAQTGEWMKAREEVLRYRAEAQNSKDFATAELARKKVATYDQIVAAQTTIANARYLDAQARMVSAQAAMKRAESGIGGGNQAVARHFYTVANDAVNRAERSYSEAEAALEVATQNQADDTVTGPLQQKVAAAKAGLATAKAQLQVISGELQHNVPLATHAQRSSGATRASVTNASKTTYKPGQIYVDASGNRAKYNADGTWTPLR